MAIRVKGEGGGGRKREIGGGARGDDDKHDHGGRKGSGDVARRTRGKRRKKRKRRGGRSNLIVNFIYQFYRRLESVGNYRHIFTKKFVVISNIDEFRNPSVEFIDDHFTNDFLIVSNLLIYWQNFVITNKLCISIIHNFLVVYIY